MSRRLGLIIGINHYQDPTFQPLQYAENDAKAIAQWLVNNQGGKWSPADVQLVQGKLATRELVESLIGQLCFSVAEAGDLVLIYFAGHVFLDERYGASYIALSNTYSQNPQTALSLDSIVQSPLLRSRASQVLLILDTFQTGALWNRYRTSPYDVKPLLGSTILPLLQQQPNHLLLCSCRGNELVAETGERGLGLFTHRLIVSLCGPASDPSTGTITLQQLHAHLYNTLGEQQRPHLFGQMTTPVVLVGSTPTPPDSTAPPLSPTSAPFMQNQARTQTPVADMPVTGQSPPYATTTVQPPPARSRITSGLYSDATTIVERERQQRLAQTTQPSEANIRTILRTAALQVAGLLIGTLGIGLPIFKPQLPALIGLALASFALALLCANATRSAFRYGFSHFIPTLLLSLATGLIPAIAYKLFSTKIIDILKTHYALLVPLLFLVLWLMAAASAPLFLALGGLIGGAIRRSRSNP